MVRFLGCLVYGMLFCMAAASCKGGKDAGADKMDELMLCQMTQDLTVSAVHASWKYEGRILEDFTVKDINGEEALFSALLDDRYKLIFVFSKTNCNVCIDAEVERLVDLAKKIDNSRVLILSQDGGVRQVLSYMIDRNIKYDVRIISNGTLGDVMEKENMPWVCVMKNDMKIENFFVPVKELAEYNDYYHNVIYERYLQ